MAGKIRIKVSLEDVESFWMFVDFTETPHIVDIQQKVERRVDNVKVACMFLDGCLLPGDETSELLRDSDIVHVKIAECEDRLCVSTSSQPKSHRKRKHSDEDGEDSALETQVWQTTKKSSASGLKTKKSKKENLITASGCQKSCEKRCKSNKEKKKKCQKKSVPEEDIDIVAVENEGVLEHSTQTVSVSPAVSKPNEDNNEISTGTHKVKPVVSEVVSLINSSTPGGVTDSSIIEKKKKRRRQKKKTTAKNRPEAENDSSRTQTTKSKPPAEIRLPKWQQAQNKKIVFSSDGEPDCELPADAPVQSLFVGSDKSKNMESQASNCQEVSDDNSSFSESFPSATSPKTSKRGLVQTVTNGHGRDDAENSNGGPNLVSAGEVSDMNMPEDVNVCTSLNASAETEECVVEKNGEDEWYKNQQYREKLSEERNLRRRYSSALDKSVTPVHLYTGSRHEPDLAEYLKMSPEERGVKVPPNVTARRLSNGAMLYSRSPATATADWKTASPFKKPATCTPLSPAKAAASAFSSPQQPERINTNKSMVIQNPPRSSADIRTTEMYNNRDGSGILGEGEKVASDPETIVLTPVCQDYSLFPDLTAAPSVGDLIAYKVLEMGDDYTPGISDYKEAEVFEYDASTQNVTVKLLHFNQKKAPGKFDLPGGGPVELEDQVILELSSMFEPKLVSTH